MTKDINLQILGVEQTLNTINPRKSKPGHIIIRLLKTKHKEKILMASRKNSLLLGNNDSSDFVFLFRNCAAQKEVEQKC